MDTAARVLALAQQTADQAIADARREADETLGRARREADEILGKARRQAEQITSDARARAETLERDAQERHRQAMGSLVQQREELERMVDDLRAFEREYRSRLKAYLEGQLRDLEAGSHGGPFGAQATRARSRRSPPSPLRRRTPRCAQRTACRGTGQHRRRTPSRSRRRASRSTRSTGPPELSTPPTTRRRPSLITTVSREANVSPCTKW